MILKVFAIRDAKVEAFLQPFFSPTTPAAIRSVSDAVNDPQHQFAKHVSDYSLWELGEFDDQTGLIVPTEMSRPIVPCNELVHKM